MTLDLSDDPFGRNILAEINNMKPMLSNSTPPDVETIVITMKYEQALRDLSYKDNIIAKDLLIIQTLTDNQKLLNNKLRYAQETIQRLEEKIKRQRKILTNY